MCKKTNNVTMRVYNIHHAQAVKEKTPEYTCSGEIAGNFFFRVINDLHSRKRVIQYDLRVSLKLLQNV